MELKKYIINDYPDVEYCQYDYYNIGKDGARPTEDMYFKMEDFEYSEYKDGVIARLVQENKELKEKIKKVSW